MYSNALLQLVHYVHTDTKYCNIRYTSVPRIVLHTRPHSHGEGLVCETMPRVNYYVLFLQPSSVVASIVQPSAEEMRKRQLANQLFGGGGGGVRSLSGPARAPRHKRKGEEPPGKIESSSPRKLGVQNEVKSEAAATNLLLDLQVSSSCCPSFCIVSPLVQWT